MKQSSIEWMVEQIEKSSKEGDIDFLLWNLKQNLLVEAKAMHKEEITDAHAHGRNVERGIDDGIFTSEEYYNENFNTK